MTDSEKLDLLLTEMQSMKQEMQSMIQEMKSEIQDTKSEVKSINDRIDNLESQIQQTERVLKNEIRKECSFVLDEVERVHNILYKYKKDTTVHTA